MKQDDLLYIKSIDRLGRNYGEILEQWRILTKEKGIDIVVLDMPLMDNWRGKDLMGTFLSDIVFQALSFVAENEQTFDSARTKELRQQKLKKLSLDILPFLILIIFGKYIVIGKKKITLRQAAEACGMPVRTFYAKARKFENST